MYIENSKEFTHTKKYFRANKPFQHSSRIKNKQKLVVFLYTSNEQSKNEIEKIIPLTIVSKRIKYLGINLTKGKKINVNRKNPVRKV